MKKLLFQDTTASNNPIKKTTFCIIFTIFLSCLFTAIAQGSSFFYSSHSTKVLALVFLAMLYASIFLYLKLSRKLNENTIVFLLILLGVLLRCGYVLLSGLYDRQHDAGAYTGMGTDFINPGHIGYIKYIYKFHKLPDLNPYELFAYYHPPLHHFISFLWLQLNIFAGVAEDLAFENLQILPLFYSCLFMTVVWKTLKVLEIRETGLYIGLSFVALHPATIIMAGSVNNDMLTILFMSLTIFYSLMWIRNKDLKGLIKLSLVIGLGMITKLNSAVLAIPLGIIFLMHFISVLKQKDKGLLFKWIKNYCIFGAIVITIGLSWIIRNLIRFSEKPGVPVPGETSPMYTAPYSLWERLGIPALADWHFDFPFHPIGASACNNTWVIMFHTSMFTEEYPAGLSDILLSMCQLTFILAVFLGITTAILLVFVLISKRTRREDTIFLLTGYVIMLISFAAFVIIYPYTCSSDFRYVAICLVYTAIALGLGNKYYLSFSPLQETNHFTKIKAVCMHIINACMILMLTCITLIYLFWERW